MYLAKFVKGLLRDPHPRMVRENIARNRKALGEHMGVILRDLPSFAPTAVRIACRRFFSYRRLPFVLPPQRSNRFHLFYQTEHLPNWNSRLTLCDEVDRHGIPRLKAHVAFGEGDFQTVLKANRIFARRIAEGGFGDVAYEEEKLRAQLESSRHSFNSSAHHIGTTRMSVDPAEGVVDPDCKVHGIENLYIAGSSVFPTSGHANPTLMLVALADRLGVHLRDTITTPTISIPI
jgi:choline dehydrogenase-like flavoprotein